MPQMPETIRLPGGRLWTLKSEGVPGYSSACGNYDVLIGQGYVVLVSFIHEPIDQCEFWRKRFASVEEAIEYAETI